MSGNGRMAALALLAAGLAAGSGPALRAQYASDPGLVFDKIEAMVPVRDGTRLYTEVYVPKHAAGPLPILLTRTPYGLSHDAAGFHSALTDTYRELARDGYVFAFQDIRGRSKSEGEFVMLRPPRDPADPASVDEATDTYDTVEWLLGAVPNNGRVGILGISYGGWLTVMAMLDPHPAVKAVSPQAPAADMFIGDDFHHNGAFRLSYGFEYVYAMETGKGVENFAFDRYDTYDWYLALGALSNVNARYFHGARPSWNDFAAHPNYDAFWKRQAVAPYLERVTVPTLNVAGWWDQEDFYGPLTVYRELETHDADGKNFLVVGPWNHGGWAESDGDHLGRIRFGAPTGRYFREQVQVPFFAHFLKDRGRFDVREALVFETGGNRWRRHDTWPPRSGVTPKRLYLREKGRLSFEPPARDGDAEADRYVSDPAHPVPYRPRPIEQTYPDRGWSTWLVQDQRFVDGRPDVLAWETEPLEADVVLAGEVEAHLFASTTGGGSDWVVKLIDVFPEEVPADPSMGGYQLMVAGDVVRGRFREGFETPVPVEPGTVEEYPLDLHSTDHRFGTGHRIMVQVQSTWFPVIDRNPQTWVPNIFEAKDADYRPATQAVHRSKRYPSHLRVSVAAE
jgi:uncharacterized protein